MEDGKQIDEQDLAHECLSYAVEQATKGYVDKKKLWALIRAYGSAAYR